MAKTLVPIFADQLSLNLRALMASEPDDSVVLMMEVREEALTVPHHRKKLVFLFAAMRHFAKSLEKQGWTVDYVALDDDANTGAFTSEIKRAMTRHNINAVCVTEPSEYRFLEIVKNWEVEFECAVNVVPDDRFLATKEEFAEWAEGRKQLRMEYFYRDMRRRTALLMDGDDPVGGQWNFDKQNRKPAKPDLFMPKPVRFNPDDITRDVITLVDKHFESRFGDIDGFDYAVTRESAKQALSDFIENALPKFGDYQDAMLSDEPFLYHSLLSMYLNVGVLAPLEICEAAEKAYEDGTAPINAVEGFIRQIIGWREYVRGIYWLKMPGYLEMNKLNAHRDLPDFYWTGDTDMHCLSQAIGQTITHAYAHHIQRLMITGNFALLIGADPKQVHEWYLAVYLDAFEWVELPNTLGMSQFGDGGLLGSKPYASSGYYIERMSNYCESCAYNVKKRSGDKACPFNSLYWHFIQRNADELRGNPRMNMIYGNWDKMSADKQETLIRQAEQFLDSLEPTKGDYL